MEIEMPKATVTMASGAKVMIEGTSDEVVAMVARLEGAPTASLGRARPSNGGSSKTQSKSKPTLSGLISEMIAGGYFKEPKQLGAVKVALEETGQFYPVTTLSPAMLRLVRAKELRRIKDSKGRWTYVG